MILNTDSDWCNKFGRRSGDCVDALIIQVGVISNRKE